MKWKITLSLRSGSECHPFQMELCFWSHICATCNVLGPQQIFANNGKSCASQSACHNLHEVSRKKKWGREERVEDNNDYAAWRDLADAELTYHNTRKDWFVFTFVCLLIGIFCFCLAFVWLFSTVCA